MNDHRIRARLRHRRRAARRQANRERRESVWSVPSGLKRWYFGLFIVQVVIAAGLLTRQAIADPGVNGVSGIALYLWGYGATAAGTAAAVAISLIESWRGVMVIAEGLKEFFDRKFAEMDKKAAARDRERAEQEQERARQRAEQEQQRQEQRAAEIRAAQESGRAEGEAALQMRWVEWNARREAAMSAGDEFSEPPPAPEPAAPSVNGTHPAEPE